MTEKAKSAEAKSESKAKSEQKPSSLEEMSEAQKEVQLSDSEAGKEDFEQQAENTKNLVKADERNDASLAAAAAFEELQTLQNTGSVLYDAEAKKAALMVTAHDPKAEAEASKEAAANAAKVTALELKAVQDNQTGNVLYDAEAKKAALLGGNPAAEKSTVRTKK